MVNYTSPDQLAVEVAAEVEQARLTGRCAGDHSSRLSPADRWVSSLISEIANNQLNLEYDKNKRQFAEAAELCNVSLIEKLV